MDPFINSQSSILDEFASFELQIIRNEPDYQLRTLHLKKKMQFRVEHRIHFAVVYGFGSNQILILSSSSSLVLLFLLVDRLFCAH